MEMDCEDFFGKTSPASCPTNPTRSDVSWQVLSGSMIPWNPDPSPRIGRSNDFWKWIAPRTREPIYDDEGQETDEFTEAVEGYHRIKWPSVGMVAGPRARLAWRVLDSRYFGVPQRRRRVYVVADFGGGPDPAAVLFEPRGQGRGAAPGGEAREGVAGTISARTKGGGGLGTDMDLAGGLQVAATVSQHNAKTGNERNEADRVVVTHALKAEGADGSEDGTGRGVPIIAAYLGNAEGGNPDAPSLNASNGKKGVNNQTALVAVFDPNQITNPDNRSQPAEEMAHALPAQGNAPVLFSIQGAAGRENPTSGPDGVGVRGDGVSYTLEARAEVQAVAFNLRGREGGSMPELGTDQASALRSADGGGSAPMALAGPQVRRLTPVECERLQGFPDGYTLIPGLSGWRDLGDDEDADELRAQGLTVNVTKSGKRRVNDPDGPRYKSLGNSFTTEPVNWIMSRVQASLRDEPMPDWQPMQLWTRGPWRPK